MAGSAPKRRFHSPSLSTITDVAAARLFLSAEAAAERRLDADGRKESARHPEAERALRLVATDQVDVPPLHRRQVIDRAREVAAPVEEVGRRHGFAPRVGLVGRRFRDGHDPLDRGHVVGMEHQRADDAEHGGVGAQSERQRHRRGRGQARPLEQGADRKARFHEQSIHDLTLSTRTRSAAEHEPDDERKDLHAVPPAREGQRAPLRQRVE